MTDRREALIEALTYEGRGARQGGILRVPHREILLGGETREYSDWESVPATISYGPEPEDKETFPITWMQVRRFVDEDLIERCGGGAHTSHYAATLKTWRRAPANVIPIPR